MTREEPYAERHAFLIMAHKSASQINRLIRVLDSAKADIYLHIDKKAGLDQNSIVDPQFSSLKFCPSIDVHWADYSQTKCEVEMLRFATGVGHYAYYHLLSESDFPLLSVGEMAHRLEGSDKLYLHFARPDNVVATRQFVNCYHPFQKKLAMVNRDSTFSIYKVFEKLSIAGQRFFRVNRIPSDLVLKKGANWFSIPDDFARFVVTKGAWIESQFHSTRSSDEFFMQTIAYNNPSYRERIYSLKEDDSYETCLRHIDWNRGNPYTFVSADYDELLGSGMLFARKFDESVDEEILVKLESHLKNK